MPYCRRAALAILLGVVTAVMSGLPGRPVDAASFTVNSTADETDADRRDNICLTASGSCTLRAAIQQANTTGTPDTIIVPAGLYVVTIVGRNEDDGAVGDFDIKSNVTIIGAGPNTTIIDANQLDRIFDVQRRAVLTIAGVTVRNGLTLTEGLINRQDGAGIRVGRGATLNITDTVITDNTAFIDVVNCTCHAGGGVYAGPKSRVRLSNVVVSNNVATNPTEISGAGGGIAMELPKIAVLSAVMVTGNAAVSGAGIYVAGRDSSSILLTDVTVDNNTATSGTGAGIVATGDAGSRLTLSNVTISNNHGPREGIAVHEISAVLTNVTVSGHYRGVVLRYSSKNVRGATLTNLTIADNVVGLSAVGPLVMRNTVVANNTVANCEFGPIASAGNNLDSGSTCGFSAVGDLSNTDPLLVAPAHNGGTNQTYALLAGSPAIDAGTNAACPSTDQRGFPRPIDGDGNGTSLCDIGAFEAQ